MQIVPFTSDSAQTFTCALNGAEYDFYARYSDRSGVWTFDITNTATQASLARGIPILCGCDLLKPYALEIGSMVAVDMASFNTPMTIDGTSRSVLQSEDAGADDLGVRVKVFFLAPGESLT